MAGAARGRRRALAARRRRGRRWTWRRWRPSWPTIRPRSPWSPSCGPTTRWAASSPSRKLCGWRTPPACRCIPTPCRPSARCRLISAGRGLDAMSVSGHKIGGPVGVGALLLGRAVKLTPVQHGGGQERDVRSGTLDTASIAAFAAAAEAAAAQPGRGVRTDLRAPGPADRGRPRRRSGGRAARSAPGPGRLPGNAHFTFPGCEGDSLLFLLDLAGVESSTGSACTAGVPRPSHVLLAMGLDEDTARGAQRFSSGPRVHGRRRRCPAGRPAGAPMPAPARPAWPGTSPASRPPEPSPASPPPASLRASSCSSGTSGSARAAGLTGVARRDQGLDGLLRLG